MSITISNLRIIPYGQKDTLKPVFGDTMHLTFRLADAPLDGDRYLLGLDYERILFPTMRPLCAYTEEYTASQNDVSFDLAINTERFALWASTLKKPTPIWLQLVRVRGEEYTTILLDDILALPSVVDGANMVFPGTPLEDILENKADLVDGKVPLSQLPPIGFEQQQADWDESDSSVPSYIRNKPEIGEARWGSITGDLSAQTDLADALDGKANLVGGKVPSGELPIASSGAPGISSPGGLYGLKMFSPGSSYMVLQSAASSSINGREAGGVSSNWGAITPDNLNYAVRSVLPNVTTIPAATTAYTLLDASATTNSHSAHYTHAPTGIPTYTLPAVTNTTIAHEILLDVDFTTVQACGFVDSQSAEIPLQSDISIAAGDKWRFICVYSLDGWRVYPLPIEVAGGGGGTSTLIVQGTTATSAGLAGTYEITNDTVNDHPVWYNSTNSKYLWLVENGMDAGWFGWVIGSTVAQQSAGDIPMFYEYFVADVTSPADTPVGLTWRTQMDELTAAQFTCVEG